MLFRLVIELIANSQITQPIIHYAIVGGIAIVLILILAVITNR